MGTIALKDLCRVFARKRGPILRCNIGDILAGWSISEDSMASHAPAVATADPAIASMHRVFDQQKQAFKESDPPSLRERREHLERLIRLVGGHRDAIVEAISTDFGNRSAAETLSAEIMVTLQSLRYAKRHARRWMQPQHARVGLLMASTSAKIVYQPKGVVGIIAPWNYPLLMVMRPLAYAVAAGNRVMIKPSEFTPATSALIAELVSESFDTNHISVITGHSEVGIAFSQLPFDHLLFTGSTGIGRHVMRAAAENLTPVTLELGGKSPVIIADDTDLDMAAERIAFGKLLNAGQTCTAPDYVLCPQRRQPALVEALRAVTEKMFPTLRDNDDATTIVNDMHYERLQALLHDARSREAKVTELNAAGEQLDPAKRKMPLHLVQGVSDDMRIAQEEIFGPILPIIDCESVEAAIDYINARPRPLALNLFTNRRADIDNVTRRTLAGGMCINDTVMHVAVEDMPFGGVGESGMGRYQGRRGFETFSNAKAVFRRPRWLNTARTLYPPYGGRLQKLLHRFFIR